MCIRDRLSTVVMRIISKSFEVSARKITQRYFNCIFEKNSLKGLFGQNTKKLKISKLWRDFLYLKKLALNKVAYHANNWNGSRKCGDQINISTRICKSPKHKTKGLKTKANTSLV